MSDLPVLAAGPADEERAIATIVRAFAADPPARWMFPDTQQYLEHFPQFARAFGGRALSHGGAWQVDGFAGVALWLPPGVSPDERALTALLERVLDPDRLQQVFEILSQLGPHHPAEPHWYLPMTGVDPDRQRLGHGSLLLRHALQKIDAQRLPAYLESTSAANVPLYERHGFELLATIRVGDAPPMFPMLRKAATRRLA